LRSRLSFEILQIILVALLVSVLLNLGLNYFGGPYFDEIAIQNRIQFEEKQKDGTVTMGIGDYLDDEGDIIELAINISIIVCFSIIVYYFINKKVKYITEISNDLTSIGGGNLDYKIREVGNNEITELAKSINVMSETLGMHIDEERKILQSQHRLITGISHDLRAPLSAIIGYLYVLKDKQYTQEEDHDAYVGVALDKSLRLQELLDKLLEMATVQEQDMEIHTTITGIDEFKRAFVHYIQNEIDIICDNVDSVKVDIRVSDDNQELYLNNMFTLRVFDNLVSNIQKYALNHSRVDITLTEENEFVELRLSNECDEETFKSSDKLIERFYQVDQSRTREDSFGLGLNICMGIMEKQQGYLKIEMDEKNQKIIVVLGFRKVLN